MEAIVVKAVARELGRGLPARVHAILQPSPREVVVVLRGAAERRLLISTDPATPRAHLVRELPARLPSPTAFCRLLRKRIEGRVITAVESPGVERVLEFVIAPPRGGEPDLLLVAELMGKHSNLVLVEAATGVIVDSLQHVTEPISRVRTVLPGARYTAPPQTGRRPLDTFDGQEFETLWRRSDGSAQEVFRQVLGPGPGLVALAAARARQREDFAAEPGRAVLAEMRGCFERVARGVYRPIFYPGRGVLLTEAVPGWESEPQESAATMNEAAERYYAQHIGAREASHRREVRARELRRELKKTAAEERMRLNEIREADAAQLLQAAGTALNLAAGETPRGTSTFNVPDPATGQVRELSLDPSLGPRQNAEALFKRARKLRRREALAVQKLPAVANRRRLLEEELALVPTLPLEALTAPPGGGPTARRAGARGAPSATPPGIREYRLPGGWRILVGKSGAGNDRLTGRLAAPEDYWFHARDFPGAHVVLKGAGAQPPEEAMRAAGAAAAWHSGARTERLVDVSYTKRKNVRKVKGGPPGKVLLGESSTIRVRPGLPPPDAGEPPA